MHGVAPQLHDRFCFQSAAWTNTWYTDTFLQILANETGEKPEDILCFDLSVYHYAEPVRTGFSGDMFMAPRIDNISSVQACLTGLIEANPSDGISVAVLFEP